MAKKEKVIKVGDDSIRIEEDLNDLIGLLEAKLDRQKAGVIRQALKIGVTVLLLQSDHDKLINTMQVEFCRKL